MADMRPVRVFSLKVPPGGVLVDCNPGVPASLRITMAAIDPTEDPGDQPPRATLKIIHNVLDFMDGEDDDSDDEYDDDDEDITMDDVRAIERRLGITADDDDEEDDDDEDDEDDEDDGDDEMVNGGPSDPEKIRIAKENAILKAMEEAAAAEDDEDDNDLGLPNGLNGKLDKGKGRALELVDEDDISSSGMEEYVVCTLDRNMSYQQPLDITIRENEECYFRVSGGQSVYLTGNFVISPEEIESDDDSDESDDGDIYGLNGLNGLEGYEDDLEDESEEDELDDIDDPRVVEIGSDDEAPQLVKVKSGKSKNKRAAEDDADEILEGILKKISEEKSEKPQAKKLKNNAGQAVPGAETNGNTKTAKEVKSDETKESKKSKKEKEKEAKKEDTPQSNGKKVQFAEKLEQGPTPSKNAPTPTKGPRNVNGVMIDDKKVGTGPAAKKGDKVGMRYIGKLKDGKVFDSNKKGKPFTFKIGGGEVIKGWDIGVQGMLVGGERRITIPAKLGYGSKSLPQIPGNSDLVFDLKMISIN